MMAIPVAVAFLSGVVFFLLLYKLIQRSRPSTGVEYGADEGWSEAWFAEFSAFRYLPMRRLLAEEEERFFLANNAGNAEALRKFRAERRAIFRQYLSLLRGDFGRLREGVRLSLLQSGEDRSAELERLLSLEISFRRLLLNAELRLTFHWLGLEPVSPAKLIDSLQGFEFTLREARMNG